MRRRPNWSGQPKRGLLPRAPPPSSVALPLAEQHRLIVPIHPGFGVSDDDPTISSVIDYVVHYAALFDALKLHEPIDLVGHSLGGWIASLFAIFHGHSVPRRCGDA